MPRRGRDGGAGASSAEDSLVDVTGLAKALPLTTFERKAERASMREDEAYFRAHPEAESYVRPYRRGELPGLVLLATSSEPVAVAVAFVCPGERTRVFIWPHHLRATARRQVEAGARQERERRGLGAKA